jgi:hypothetical protein
VEGHVDCPYGRIDVKFSQTANRVALEVSMPVGTQASIRIPDSSKSPVILCRGGETMTANKSGQYLELKNGHYSIEFH